MKILNTKFEGVFIVENNLFEDNRGNFQKLFQSSIFEDKGIEFNINEHFFSTSHKGIIRGMHFQNPPFSQSKLVYVLQGEVRDVVLDLRKNSKTYLQYLEFGLSSRERRAVFIPEGFAHGFQSLYDNTIMVYSQSKEFDSNSDFGINPLSFGMNWPIKDSVISDKDKSLISLENYQSPF